MTRQRAWHTTAVSDEQRAWHARAVSDEQRASYAGAVTGPQGESPDTTIWGLVSDVHGNAAALEQALRVLHAAGAQKLAFLGDYLGRGDSDACVRRIRGVADLAIV